MTPELHVINAGAAEEVADAFARMAEDVRDRTGDTKAAGYLALVVRLDGGVDLCWGGREISILGALEYARARICARWFEQPGSE